MFGDLFSNWLRDLALGINVWRSAYQLAKGFGSWYQCLEILLATG